jgi:hypothetical protein
VVQLKYLIKQNKGDNMKTASKMMADLQECGIRASNLKREDTHYVARFFNMQLKTLDQLTDLFTKNGYLVLESKVSKTCFEVHFS